MLTVWLCATVVLTQRPPYAGQRPTGYKDRLTTTTVTTNGGEPLLADRFGASAAAGAAAPTTRLPHLALGDAALVNQLNSRPIDQRPFWLINSEAIEAQKNGGFNRPAASSASITNIAPFAASSAGNRPALNTASDAFTPSNTQQQTTFSLSNRLGEVTQNKPFNQNNVISQQPIVYPIGVYPIVSAVPQQQSFIIVQPFQPIQQQPQQSFPNHFDSVAHLFDDDSDDYFDK